MESIEDFEGQQYYVSSERVVLDARTDYVVIVAKKGIHQESSEEISLEAKDYVVLNAPKIYFGETAHQEKHPTVLGDVTEEVIDEILSALADFSDALQSVQSTPSGTPIPAITTAAVRLGVRVRTIRKKVEKIKSKTVFVE